MKNYILCLMIIVAGCGKYDLSGQLPSGLGEIRSVSSVTAASSSTITSLGLICNALATKEEALATAVGTQHTFSATQTECDRSSGISSGDQQVVIQRTGQDYQFIKTDGLPFMFPDLETRTAGVFKELCNQGTSVVNPVVTNNNEALFISTSGYTAADCVPVPGEETCFMIEKGPVTGTTAVIKTRDIIRIRTGGNKGKIGFFTQRTRISQSICSNNGAVTSKVTLK